MRFRFDPFRELWNELSRVSSDFQHTMNDAFREGNGIRVWSDESNVYAEADLPGLDPKSIDVTIDEGRTLTITGERAMPGLEKSVWIRHERPSGKFTREVDLPIVVNPDGATSTYTNGVLTITLPKSEVAKPRKIAVG